MKCEIIKDLIPLCSEGLCSEESRKEIEEHISSCDECRKLYENVPLEKDNVSEIPSEDQTFKKVRKKFKRNKLKIVILSLVLAVVVGVVGYLTVCQICKFEYSISFETIVQSLEVRKIAGYIAEGDIDSYVSSISDSYDNDIFSYKYKDSFYKIRAEKIRSEYSELMKDMEVSRISVDSCYETLYDENSVAIINNAKIHFKNSEYCLELTFIKNYDGQFILFDAAVDINDGNQNINKFKNTLVYANNPYLYLRGVIETIIVNPNNKESSDINFVSSWISSRFISSDMDNVNNSLISFYSQGFIVDNMVMSNLQYDADKNMLYYDVSVTAKDDIGSAIMTTRLYTDESGLYSPDSEYTHVYADGCSDELVSSLEKIFG